MFNTFDDLTKSVSPYHYQVPFPACTDSFDISENAWKILENNPPIELVEKYYSCSQKPVDAAFNAVGIATGNTSIMVPIACIICLPILYVYLLVFAGVPPSDDYTGAELGAAETALALIILRIRDGKYRGVKKDSVLMKLTKDLIVAAKTEGGYADSDDSDSDDEEKGAERAGRISQNEERISYMQSSVFIRQVVVTKNESEEAIKAVDGPSEWDLPVACETELVVLNKDISGNWCDKICSEIIMFQHLERIAGLMQRAMSFKGTDEFAEAFYVAKKETDLLSLFSLCDIEDQTERGRVAIKMYNLLLMHITLEYDCPMTVAIDRYSFLASYYVMGKKCSGSNFLNLKNY